MRTFGLIPAAGKSSRMGRPKLLLPLAGKTVLDRVVASVRAGGVGEVLVVVAPGDLALREIAERAGAHVLQLLEDTAHMLHTCRHGLEWIAERFHPLPDDGWLLLPADHPTCRPEVVRALIDTALIHGDRSIVVPVHRERRGHPVWLRWHLVAAIRELPAERGLNALVREHGDGTLELPWASAEILSDLDTPEDYHRLTRDAEEAGLQ
jgi:molybdenum cofactor cytidylyltransferase